MWRIVGSRRAVSVVMAVLALVGFAAWRTLDSASSAGHGTLPPLPNHEFAGRVVHYTITEYTNYEVRGSNLPASVQAAQTNLITERWVQLDEAGNDVRFKTVTRLPSGELWQERLFQGATEIVNWYNYPGSGAACSQTSPYAETAGSSLPFANDQQIAAAGFRETDRPGDLIQAGAPPGAQSFEKIEARSPAPSLVHGRSVITRENRSGERWADLFYGVDGQGAEVLLQSTTFSPITAEQSPAGDVFSVQSLPPVCGRPK